MFLKEGLIYWALDDKGQKVGVPIKASSMYGKTTLKCLKPLFQSYSEQRKPHKSSFPLYYIQKCLMSWYF